MRQRRRLLRRMPRQCGWNRLPLWFGAMLSVLVVAAACGGGGQLTEEERYAPPAPGVPETLVLETLGFRNGGRIPPRYTCDGEDRSPPFSWGAPPAGTQSFVLLMDDPDAPAGVFTHWMLLNIPASARKLPEGIAHGDILLTQEIQPPNDFGVNGYRGPCPPQGAAHTYRIFLYALDDAPAFNPRSSRKSVVEAISEHAVAVGRATGTYQR